MLDGWMEGMFNPINSGTLHSKLFNSLAILSEFVLDILRGGAFTFQTEQFRFDCEEIDEIGRVDGWDASGGCLGEEGALFYRFLDGPLQGVPCH